MDRILATCEWLSKLRGRPVVVIGWRDVHLYKHGTLTALHIPPQGGYEGYRTQIDLIGEALMARGLGGNFVAYKPIEHMWMVASQATLQYSKQVMLRSVKPDLAIARSL
jgi:hypothetical protein